MQEGLLYNISRKPYSGRRKVAIIDDADYLNKEGANCLLKTLEEPPPKSLLILLGTSEQRQLPTIRSRCQIVRFQPLAESDVAELLVERGLCGDPATARRAAARSGGSLQLAQLWCDEQMAEFRGKLLAVLRRSEARLHPPRPNSSASSPTTPARNRPSSASGCGWPSRWPRSSIGQCSSQLTAGQPPADQELAAAVSRGCDLAARRRSRRRVPGGLPGRLRPHRRQRQPGLFIEWWLDELNSAARRRSISVLACAALV